MADVLSGRQAARNPTPAAWQLQFSPEREETTICVDIDAIRFRVGRRESADLRPSSPQISGLHAEFVTVGMRLFVRDLSSTNGTYVNGKRIGYRDVALRHRDRVRMANVEFVVHRRRPGQVPSDTTIVPSEDLAPESDGSLSHDPASVLD